jgi:hypothetical protein
VSSSLPGHFPEIRLDLRAVPKSFAERRDAAIELLARFFREEALATPQLRIAENFGRMLADLFCWSALALDGETAQAVITVSTNALRTHWA